MDETLLLVEVGVIVVLAILGMVAVYAKQYKRVPPGRAMVVFGRRFPGGKPLVMLRGGRFIQPIIESYALLSIEPMQIDLFLEDAVGNISGTGEEVRRLNVSVAGVAKISEDADLLQTAASHLVNKSPEEIRHIVEATVEGHVRGILATTPAPETAVRKVSEKIRSAAEGDLALMGIAVPSLFLRIRDTKPMSRGIEVVEQVSRELHRLDLRIRRIEEKLGLSTP